MKIKTYLDYEVILANKAQPVCFAVRFEAPKVSQARPRPAAFCLVIDRSGSMQGPPLANARQAAQLAIRHLRPEDQISVVGFDDQAQVIVPLQTPAQREQILRSVDQIHAGGSTNLTGGWSLGRDELKKCAPECPRRLLLLSDGQLNAGIIEPEAVRQIVGAGLESHSIRTSCLGFGPQYNEDLMRALAQATGGQFYDAEGAEKFPAIFESELEGLQKLTIQNLRIRVRRLEFCETLTALGTYPSVELPDGAIEFAVGDLISEESRIVCWQLGVLPLPYIDGQPVASLEGERLLEVEILWDQISETEIQSRTFAQTVRIQATQNPEEIRQCTEAIPWISLQRAGRAIDESARRMDDGKPEAAAALLQQTIALLKQYQPGDLAKEALQQLERLLSMVAKGQLSERDIKLHKYHSHSYRRMSSHEFWSSPEPPPSFKQQPPPAPPAPPAPPPSPSH